MSLFVKDMDIPPFNPEDALYTHYPACICVFPDGTANLKILIPQYDGTYRQDPNEYAIENIPAPHGRLIDADAYQYSGDLIDEPTIIEAEVSEE